jgi:copper(I)-binding protein
MALHTLGTINTTALQCTSAWLSAPPPGGAFTAADLAAVNQSITSDDDFGSILQGYSFGVQAVLTTGTTNSNTSLTSVAASGGSPPITQIQVSDLVLGIGIPLGTFVTVVAGGGATITISQAATTSAAGTRLAFVRLAGDVANSMQGGSLTAQGQLFVPNRGILKVLPGDRIAVDNTGFPILVSGNSIAYAGSQWAFS